jgi:hypothetical protein
MAERLAGRDLVIARLSCDWSHMGSWILAIQRGPASDAYGAALLRRDYHAAGPDIVRFVWDGKEHLLTVSTAPTAPLTSPGPWKQVLEKSFGGSEDAIRFAEAYASQWGAA